MSLENGSLQEKLESEQKKQSEKPGKQLNMMSKIKEVEYQNSLLMKSLEEYNEKYEKLKSEQQKSLEKIKEKVNKLENANEILRKNLKKELEDVVDNIDEKINELSQKTAQHQEKLQKNSKEYLNQLNDLQQKSKNRFESYMNRKDKIDYLIYFALFSYPIILAFLLYETGILASILDFIM